MASRPASHDANNCRFCRSSNAMWEPDQITAFLPTLVFLTVASRDPSHLAAGVDWVLDKCLRGHHGRLSRTVSREECLANNAIDHHDLGLPFCPGLSGAASQTLEIGLWRSWWFSLAPGGAPVSRISRKQEIRQSRARVAVSFNSYPSDW
ncbi:hypothetical protein LIA77_09562 [Sarocladium implicatum]|nr:hypothetical protein LIA77_09562 [Sarocladium implicatum]